MGILSCTDFYLTHGMTADILASIAADARGPLPIETATLVPRWQKMMESFFACQVHVLAGVGYHPSEKGLQEYNLALAQLMGECAPSEQEPLRELSRDVWRKALGGAFGVEWDSAELELIEAREIMHGIGGRMNDGAFLSLVSEELKAEEAANGRPAGEGGDGAKLEELRRKHTMVQKLIIENIYLKGPKNALEAAGFESTEVSWGWGNLI